MYTNSSSYDNLFEVGYEWLDEKKAKVTDIEIFCQVDFIATSTKALFCWKMSEQAMSLFLALVFFDFVFKKLLNQNMSKRAFLHRTIFFLFE